MKVRLSEGWRRLLLVTLLPWLIGWGVVYIVADQRVSYLDGRFMAYNAQVIHPDYPGQTEMAESAKNAISWQSVDARAWRARAIYLGPIVPAAAIFVLLATLWVRDGFGRRSSN